MIKIICDEKKELLKTEDFKATAFRGVLEMRGDNVLCAHQLAVVLGELIKSDGEFMDMVMDSLSEVINAKSN